MIHYAKELRSLSLKLEELGIAGAVLCTSAAFEVERLTNESAKSKWQPITTAPRDGTEFDGWSPEGFRVSNVYWAEAEGKFFQDDNNGASWPQELTYWRPLPEPPAE